MTQIKKLALLILTFFLLSNISFSKETVTLKPGENSYEKNGLTLKVIIIDSWEQTMEVMKTGKGNVQQIIPETKFELGSQAIPFILYKTNATKKGKAKITYNIKVIRPDGTLDFERVNLTVIDGKPSPELGMYQQPSGCKTKKTDPVGIYKFLISIYDHYKDVEVEFELKFEVIEKFNTIKIIR